MKKEILIFGSLLCLFLTSCSEDDNDPMVMSEKYLSEIKTNLFNSAGVQTGYKSKIYENNKPIIEISYDMNNDTISKSIWSYSNNKLTFKESSSTAFPINNTLIEYDSIDRIVYTENMFISQGDAGRTRTYFTYESDSIIISESIYDMWEGDPYTYSRTFLLNDNGLIYKYLRPQNASTEVFYDNDNNVTTIINIFNNETTVTNNIYDEIHFSPENFPVYDNFIFGSYSNNSILYENRILREIKNEASLVPKFIINQEVIGNNSKSWEWAFDNENYPLTSNYNDSSIYTESEYFYE